MTELEYLGRNRITSSRKGRYFYSGDKNAARHNALSDGPGWPVRSIIFGMRERAAALIEEAASIPDAVWPGIIQWHRNLLTR